MRTHPEGIAAGRGTRTLALFFAAVVLARIPLLCLPFDTQFSLLSDDAFYYLEAARRWVTTGAWPSMDGIHPTNGFHPLYMGLVGLVQSLLGSDPGTVVPMMLGVDLALNALLVWVLVRACSSAWNAPGAWRPIPLAALLLLALDPGWIAHALSGVENSLSSLLLLLYALRIRGELERPAHPPVPAAARRLVLEGLLAGACVLARSDGALWIALGFGFQFARARARFGTRRAAVEFGVRALAAAAILTPWLVANLQQFGGVAQDSALAIRARLLALDGPAGSAGWLRRSVLDLGFWAYRLAWAWGLIPLTGALIGLSIPWDGLRRPGIARASAIALPVLCALALALHSNDFWSIVSPREAALELAMGGAGLVCGLGLVIPRPAAPSSFTRWIVASTVVTVLTYALWFGHFQPWYTSGPTALGILLLTAPALVGLSRARPTLARTLVVLMALLLVSRTWGYAAHGAYEGRLVHPLEQGARLRTILETTARERNVRFGSFDSGRLSYVVHPFPVTNLDGVMNHGASLALRRRRLGAYLESERITYILSPPARVREFQQVSPFETRSDSVLARVTGHDVVRVVRLVRSSSE